MSKEVDEREEGAACVNTTVGVNVKTELQRQQSELIQMMQAKTQDLRGRIELVKCELQTWNSDVQHMPWVRYQNDRRASIMMQQLYTREQTRQPPTNLNHVVQSVPMMNDTVHRTANVGQSTAFSTAPAQATFSRKVNKTRRELQEEVDALQELVLKLSLGRPEIAMYVLNVAQNNSILSQMPVFRNFGGNDGPSCSRNTYIDPMPTIRPMTIGCINGKVRHESEVSTASSVISQNGQATPALISSTKDDDSPSKKKRKRGNRGKNKVRKNELSTLQTESEALVNYINHIVVDYVGAQSELAAQLVFNGSFSDLESHAQSLVAAGLGRIVEDEIRVNRKNNRQSFITMSYDREGLERDGIIMLPVARRYAFEGDIVRAFVFNARAAVAEEKPKTKQQVTITITGGKESISPADDDYPFEEADETESHDSDDIAEATAASDNCPKAFVISIVKQTEQRQIVGTISFKNPINLCDDKLFYKLKPHDMRVPIVYVSHESCLAHIEKIDADEVCGLLYLAHILETDANGHCIAELLQPVGKVGNLEAEIKAILMHNGLRDVVPYEERFNEMFAQPDPPIDAEQLGYREDLRDKCIFTIDPLTARDLDDAVSVDQISPDECEVGVHISDVSHYLLEDTELDNIVKERATSIYLVTEVIHMLPKPLCFKCSLLPGEDKFAFSVFWRMNIHGEVLGKPRFTRSVIRSCTQFAYEHAQKIIDNPIESFESNDFPTICNGFEPQDICTRVLILQGLARSMRRRRYEHGALSINNPKLRFNMDPENGEPLDCEVDVLKEANWLIEEFMLLANQSVASFIYERYPDISILRNHAPPLSNSMKALRSKLSTIGLVLDYSSSKAIQESMLRLCDSANDPEAMDACLSALLMKPMARAKYFCSEGKSSKADLWHYALSIPIYTHFTSPIRRYPDILVHRLLAAALDYCPPPKRTTEELHCLAKTANDRKYSAKTAGDESVNLFFKRFVKNQQSLLLKAVVIEIFQHMLNVVTIETGHVIAINYKMQKVLVDTTNTPNSVLILERNSLKTPLKLQLLSTILIRLVVWDDKLCGFFVSPDPQQRQLNSKESSKKKQNNQSNNNSNNNSSIASSLSESLNGKIQIRKQLQFQQQQQQQKQHPSQQQQQQQQQQKQKKQRRKEVIHVYAVRTDSQ